MFWAAGKLIDWHAARLTCCAAYRHIDDDSRERESMRFLLRDHVSWHWDRATELMARLPQETG